MGSLNGIEILFLVCFFVVPVIGIVDAARLPKTAWDSAGRSKRFWILAQVVTLYIGTVAYFSGVRADVKFFTAPIAPDWEEVD